MVRIEVLFEETHVNRKEQYLESKTLQVRELQTFPERVSSYRKLTVSRPLTYHAHLSLQLHQLFLVAPFSDGFVCLE